jgi:hypothetical protein
MEAFLLFQGGLKMIDLLNALSGGHVMHLASGTNPSNSLSSTVNTSAPNQNLAGISTAMSRVKGLLGTATNGIMGVGGIGGALMIGYHALMRNLSGGDQSVDAHHLSAIKKVAVGTAVVVCAGAIGHFAAGAL